MSGAGEGAIEASPARSTGVAVERDARYGDAVGGRIFHGNPWPNGHAIKQFTWTGRVEPEGLFFAFNLQTEKYDAEEPGIEFHRVGLEEPPRMGRLLSIRVTSMQTDVDSESRPDERSWRSACSKAVS